MHYLLSRLFDKRNIKDISELSKDEKQDFINWQKILTEGEVTLESVGKFCQEQVSYIEGQFKDINLSKEKMERLVLLHGVYSTLRDIITKPRADKEALEKYLQGLLST